MGGGGLQKQKSFGACAQSVTADFSQEGKGPESDTLESQRLTKTVSRGGDDAPQMRRKQGSATPSASPTKREQRNFKRTHPQERKKCCHAEKKMALKEKKWECASPSERSSQGSWPHGEKASQPGFPSPAHEGKLQLIQRRRGRE